MKRGLKRSTREAMKRVNIWNKKCLWTILKWKRGFFLTCRVWLGQAVAVFVKHGIIHCDSIPGALEQDAIDEADKVKEAVERGLRKVAVIVSKLSKRFGFVVNLGYYTCIL